MLKGLGLTVLALLLLLGLAAGTAHRKDVSGATLVVAAADSLFPSHADLAADGTDDQEVLQRAIDRLPAFGGKVLLLEGTFQLTEGLRLRDGVALEGMGAGTVDDPATAAGVTVLTSEAPITLALALDADYFQVRRLKLLGGRKGLEVTTTVGAGPSTAFHIADVVVGGQTETGDQS